MDAFVRTTALNLTAAACQHAIAAPCARASCLSASPPAQEQSTNQEGFHCTALAQICTTPGPPACSSSTLAARSTSSHKSHRTTGMGDAGIAMLALATMGCTASDEDTGMMGMCFALGMGTTGVILLLGAFAFRRRCQTAQNRALEAAAHRRANQRKTIAPVKGPEEMGLTFAIDRSFLNLFGKMLNNEDPYLRIGAIQALGNELPQLTGDQREPIVDLIARGFDDHDDEVRLEAIQALSDKSHLLRNIVYLCGDLALRYSRMACSAALSKRVRLAAIKALERTLPNTVFPNIDYQENKDAMQSARYIRAASIVPNLWDTSDEIRRATAHTLKEFMQYATSAREAQRYAKAIVRKTVNLLDGGSNAPPSGNGAPDKTQPSEMLDVLKVALPRLTEADTFTYSGKLGEVLVEAQDVTVIRDMLLIFTDVLNPLTNRHSAQIVMTIQDLAQDHPDHIVRKLALKMKKKMLAQCGIAPAPRERLPERVSRYMRSMLNRYLLRKKALLR